MPVQRKCLIKYSFGRLQYLKYTVWNTIAYWIRGAIIPQTCLNKIGKICAKFLYFGDTNGKKLHLVSWNNTSRPKILGGLGIPNLKALQFASCCSLIIRFYNSNSLLFDYLNEKYGTPWTPVRNNTSALWNWMIKVAHSIAPNLKFAYTPNSRIALLWDPWLDGCQFNYSSQDIRDNFPFHAKFSDYVDLGTWLLPEPLVQNLDSFSITSVASHGVTWKTCKPCFSVFILEYFKGVEPVSWAKFLWHKHFALKYTIYAWLALNRGLKTADELSRRNILINHTCPLCFNHPESADHLFFECDYGFTILVKLMPSLGNFFFRPRLLQLLEYLGDCDFLDKGKQNLYLLTPESIHGYFPWIISVIISVAHLSARMGFVVEFVLDGNNRDRRGDNGDDGDGGCNQY
ncbi:hypothetical protein M5K25_026171 [Dendrobium thyrsiflorum]|uniref:Reverse transcriptase zinc-binding domain-containing protein n=1 Tax=Dendrobium thyrsiflorum TaxID=117978 RepID=A0ABD0TWL3_DENTH